MDSKDLPFAPVSELAPKIASGAVKPGALLEACIGRIEKTEPALNAFITKTFDTARRDAEEREAEVRRGILRSPLHGIPVAVKDNVDLAGVATTAGSGILKDNLVGGTATCAVRLLEAGALILGKTNLQEFARGPTGADSHFGPTLNPWDPDRTSGGSSSGSGAAASSGMAVAALGSDTGGSVRIPAAFCGIAGIRPTYGRVSRAGVVPLGLSFDTLGPLTRTVEDAAIFLQAMAGPDPLDHTTGNEPPPAFRARIGEGVEGLIFGVPTNHFWPGMDGEVEKLAWEAVSALEAMGGRVIEMEIPWAEHGVAAYSVIVGAESAEYHRTYLRERRDAYTSTGADFFEESLFIPAWRYVQAQRVRTLFLRQAAAVFRKVDAVLTPTVPITPPTIADCLDGNKTWAAILHCTAPFSPLGSPVLQVPCGFTRAGQPAGLQIAGRWGEEALLFRIGTAYERAHPWWRRRPPLAGAE